MGGSKNTPKQILNAAVAAVTESGVFQGDIKKRREQAATDKTYQKCKYFFMKAYRSWRKSLCITAGNYFPWVKSITYHTQNTSPMSGSVFSNKLSESLANLATTTSADRATVVTLTDTMAKLSAELAAVQLELVSSLLEKQKILKLVSDRCQRTSRGGGGTPNFQEVNRRDPGQAPLFTTVIAHGFNCPHPSFKCPDLNSTHTKNSTKKDTIGDNQEIYKAI